MQYIKALILVVFFFVAMLFLCQNQVALSKDVVLSINLLFVEATESVTLPFYFVAIAAFLLGCVCCFLLLAWERVRMSARCMRANWRLRSIQNEQLQMIAQLRELAHSPQEARAALYEKFKESYEKHKRARDAERRKKDDVRQLTIEATASATPTRTAQA